MGFNDIMLIEPAPMSLDRGDEIDSIARDKIAARLQTRLRATLDPGADLKAATRVQALHVSAAGDAFVSRREDQAHVVKPAAAPTSSSTDSNEVGDIEQLFEMSSGVPTADANGRLVYRTISRDTLFGAHKRAAHRQVVEQTVAATLRDELVEAYDEAIQDVGRQRGPR